MCGGVGFSQRLNVLSSIKAGLNKFSVRLILSCYVRGHKFLQFPKDVFQALTQALSEYIACCAVLWLLFLYVTFYLFVILMLNNHFSGFTVNTGR